MDADASPTDAELVDRANRQWPDAAAPLGALYERHKAWVLRVAERFAPDRDTAMDAVQETFIALFERFPGFELRGRLTTFLYPVVRNAAVTAGRRRSRERVQADPAAGVPASPPPARPELRTLLDAVADLPPVHREVLIMRVVDEMSVGEVAIALGVPAGTVKSRLHKALERLRDDPRTHGYFLGEDG